jgi:hypothetical protein
MVNQEETSPQSSSKSFCSRIPCLFWYIVFSFFAYWVFRLATTCINGNTFSWIIFVVETLLVFALIFFIYRVVSKHEDFFCGCRNVIAVLFIIICVISFIVIMIFGLFGVQSIVLWILLILSLNLICAIAAHWYLVSKYGHKIAPEGNFNSDQDQDNATKN